MKIYADSSALIAWFHPQDQFAEEVTRWCRERSPEFMWNPFLRGELRHHLRRLTGDYAGAAWHAYRAAETSNRLRLDMHRPSEMLEWGDELAARHSAGIAVGFWDCVHVAIAEQLRVDVFVTCDAAQADLARKCRLAQVHLFG